MPEPIVKMKPCSGCSKDIPVDSGIFCDECEDIASEERDSFLAEILVPRVQARRNPKCPDCGRKKGQKHSFTCSKTGVV